jgi:hypothetical protein
MLCAVTRAFEQQEQFVRQHFLAQRARPQRRGTSLDCLFELSAYRKSPVKGPFDLVLYPWRELHESRTA